MGKQIVVTGVFTVAWDADVFRERYEDDISDEDILRECKHSVEGQWEFYATQPDTVDVFAELVE